MRDQDGVIVPLSPLASGWQKMLAAQGVTHPDTLELQDMKTGRWHRVRQGAWAGRVTTFEQGRIAGWAQDERAPETIVTVLALDARGTVVAHGVTQTDGAFEISLPASISHAPSVGQLTVAIAGSDFVLEGGLVAVGAGLGWAAPAHVSGMSRSEPIISIKISTPNLKEAPLWGDYHFARSLAASFAKIGLLARVDTQDSWYGKSNTSDVVLSIRGRHRVEVDTGKINLMWLISHPDRIPDREFADYDHVAVASDIYAGTLREAGLADARVMHQATDARLFGTVDPNGPRVPACLFVGNSRREYRTMVKWCVQQNVPLELYGGGWDGVLPPEAVRATSVANTDLPACYGSHLLLLNDHWDSMRGNGFLSNRLFDGSATGTPILTDPVAGLTDVFGDTIAQAGEPQGFAEKIQDCLDNPEQWLARAARARDIVLGAHTFDHRAVELARLIGLSDVKDPFVAQQAFDAALCRPIFN